MNIKDTPPPPQNPNSNPQSEPNNPPTESANDYSTRDKGKKFRFKSKSKASSRSSRYDSHRHDRYDRHKHRHGHDDHRSHRSKHTRRKRSPTPPTTIPSNPFSGPSLSPNTAFRESLFDALGDDEGAAFWETVYGQPIHNYPIPPGAGSGEAGEDDGRSKLEHMDEEEYATYVRSEMWKRTREGMIEEQERVRAEKRAKIKAEKDAGEAEEKRRFERAMDDSLRRGRERRRARGAWRGVWDCYLKSWEGVEALRNGEGGDEGKGEDADKQGLRNLLFWPVESGKRRDVSRENVEEFMRRAPVQASAGAGAGAGAGGDAEDLLLSTLKTERVRWHPDKIQHRYGALGIDESVMRSVTEVFQIIDTLWNEMKK
ncbi:hypothetical protein BDW59DRAFT_157123 [Aspergillus cavernicola]|uniref:Uncharacterized protein n=1 Tax=Aspergillus cavernicola TaxID=176166 RepID=A0ABR4IYY4_9EURO